jgi:predicted TIM-barrel fold metal-dependent hydrolase
MIDDMVVLDAAVHLHDMSDDNLIADAPWADRGRGLPLGMGEFLRPLHGEQLDFATRSSVEIQTRMLFEQSPTDLAVAQVVPVFDWYKDWWAPVELQAEFVAANPGRAWLCGGADPLHRGLDAALEHLEWQVRDLGAISVKFYNGHMERSWRCDDRTLAYPLYERAAELGVRVLQFHKGFPFGVENVEDLRPNDLQRPARDFPEIQFVIHHLGVPYFEETVLIAARFPNVHLCLGANLAFTPTAPRQVAEQIGRLLANVGVDKLSWASEGYLAGPPTAYLRAFMNLEIPDDLRAGYGYPQITDADRRAILGENMARLLGIDLDAKREELTLSTTPRESL